MTWCSWNWRPLGMSPQQTCRPCLHTHGLLMYLDPPQQAHVPSPLHACMQMSATLHRRLPWGHGWNIVPGIDLDELCWLTSAARPKSMVDPLLCFTSCVCSHARNQCVQRSHCGMPNKREGGAKTAHCRQHTCSLARVGDYCVYPASPYAKVVVCGEGARCSRTSCQQKMCAPCDSTVNST